MLKLLTTQQIREADAYAVATRPISFYELMEQAGSAFVQAFVARYPERERVITVYSGTGNNGGDGLVIARLLHDLGYKSVSVRIVRFSNAVTDDFQANYTKIREIRIPYSEIRRVEDIQEERSDIIIDALLGSGLNRSLDGDWRMLVEYLNGVPAIKVAVDIPTGFPSEGPVIRGSTVLEADHVITFQRPKINFLLPESASVIRHFEVVDIGLDEDFIQSADTIFSMVMEEDVRQRIYPRRRFTHKGTYGNALIIAGAPETMGAALLSCAGSLHGGAGLTTACIPAEGLTALNTALPEVVAAPRGANSLFEFSWNKYQAVAVGPGLGSSNDSKELLAATLMQCKSPLVLDADAINLIAANYEIMGMVPAGTIFTPHVREFDRLFGNHDNWWERLETGVERATHLGCTIILKNQYTIIFTPDGKCIFNPTGSPAMASGGSGDVLTGLLASFLAQGYEPVDAALAAVYIHGKAGRLLDEEEGYWVVPASMLPLKINKVICQLVK
jgi:ADP-dependent NAD(P)H-hydrate dehydratase / NAD(P)H-hydrate epimerase